MINEDQVKQAHLISVAERILARLENFECQLRTLMTESQADLEAIGLSADKIITISVNKQLLIEKHKSFSDQKTQAGKQLDPSISDSVAYKKLPIEKQIEQLQAKLDEPNKKFQDYLTALKEWEKQKNKIVGNESTPLCQ